jgi:hypothetical protein
LIPVRKQPGLKAGVFNPALLVPVVITGTNGFYKPGLKAFFTLMSVLLQTVGGDEARWGEQGLSVQLGLTAPFIGRATVMTKPETARPQHPPFC